MKKIYRYIRLLLFNIGLINAGDRYYYYFLPTDKIIDAEINKDKPHDIIQRGKMYSVKPKGYDILRKGFYESKELAQAFVDREAERFKAFKYYSGTTWKPYYYVG